MDQNKTFKTFKHKPVVAKKDIVTDILESIKVDDIDGAMYLALQLLSKEEIIALTIQHISKTFRIYKSGIEQLQFMVECCSNQEKLHLVANYLRELRSVIHGNLFNTVCAELIAYILDGSTGRDHNIYSIIDCLGTTIKESRNSKILLNHIDTILSTKKGITAIKVLYGQS